MKDLLILCNCFFTYEQIDRTTKSIIENNTKCTYDIIYLENPSKYSKEIYEIGKKYNILSHYICDLNIEGNVFTIFINNNKDIIDNYKYIALTETDVVLDNGTLDEIMSIYTDIEKSNDNIRNVSVDIKLDTVKYHNLPIRDWVPPSAPYKDYLLGHTGFQFITFTRDFLYKFINDINNKLLCSHIALGTQYYTGLSDSNLLHCNSKHGYKWARTKYNTLDHIGWENYILNNNEYVKLKWENINNKTIRDNIDVSKHTLIKLY